MSERASDGGRGRASFLLRPCGSGLHKTPTIETASSRVAGQEAETSGIRTVPKRLTTEWYEVVNREMLFPRGTPRAAPGNADGRRVPADA